MTQFTFERPTARILYTAYRRRFGIPLSLFLACPLWLLIILVYASGVLTACAVLR